MQVYTVTRTRAQRAASLSLRAPLLRPTPPALRLPTELILLIISLSTRQTQIAIAQVCTRLAAHAAMHFYRAPKLESLLQLTLFRRTVAARTELAEIVQTLVVGGAIADRIVDCRKQKFYDDMMRNVTAVCTELRSITLPAAYTSALAFGARFTDVSEPRARDAPTEVILDTYADLPKSRPLTGISRLRVGAPVGKYRALLTAIPPHAVPRVTHLALSRRASANEDNDLEFVEGVRAHLAAPALQTLVIAVHGGLFAPETSVEELRVSSIWRMLEAVQHEDAKRTGKQRIFIVRGIEGEEAEGGDSDAWWAARRQAGKVLVDFHM